AARTAFSEERPLFSQAIPARDSNAKIGIMKASVAFVLLAFLSATTAKVHVQNRKASEVIEDPDEANNFLKRQSACRMCDSKETCCDPRFCLVTGPSAGKCSKHPTEIARETEVTHERENLREVKENTQEQVENIREIFRPGWQ
ncbi:unnamed protein product, partial [Porites evermanni]